MLPQIKLAIIACFCAILFAAGWQTNQWRWEAKYAEQLERARDNEQALQAAMDAATRQHVEEMRSIAVQRDAAIDRLRQRAERLPESSRLACEGSTGRELSRQDAEFLVRFAADAEQHRQGAMNCYAAYDQIKEAINRD